MAEVHSQDPAKGSRRLLFLDLDGVCHPLRMRVLQAGDSVDTSHCFNTACMAQLRRVVVATGAQLVLSSSWRAFEHSRAAAAAGLDRHSLHFRDCTTVAGGESPRARVDQILEYALRSEGSAEKVWAAVDDEDLEAECGQGMLDALFLSRFVRTESAIGLTAQGADALIRLLLDTGC